MSWIDECFPFLDPPLADRSHTSWIFDHESGVLFTADGMGNYYAPGACSLTYSQLPDGVRLDEIYNFHRCSLVWLRYLDPAKLRDRLASIYKRFGVFYVASIHGNPIGLTIWKIIWSGSIAR